LAWYFGKKETENCGLRNFKQLYSIPMQSTGNEKFNVYIFYRTQAVTQEDIDWESSSEEDDSSSDEEATKKELLLKKEEEKI
jgi:hypothetical protein